MKNTRSRCTRDPHSINLFADAIFEACARKKLGLKATLSELLPKIAREFGAAAAVVETLNEDLKPEIFKWKAAPSFELGKTPARVCVKASRGLNWVSQPLDLDGLRVGTLAFGYRGPVDADGNYRACLNAVCEELDTVLWAIQSAAVNLAYTHGHNNANSVDQ